jgi:hypothetical protein
MNIKTKVQKRKVRSYLHIGRTIERYDAKYRCFKKIEWAPTPITLTANTSRTATSLAALLVFILSVWHPELLPV